MWIAGVKSPHGSPVADDAQINIVVDMTDVDADESIHCIFELEAEGNCEVFGYENVTYSGGTTYTPVNMNRTSNHTPPSGLVIKTNATLTTTSATTLMNQFVSGGKGKDSAGGGARGGHEWILKPGLKYAIALVNRAGAAKEMSLGFEFYED